MHVNVTNLALLIDDEYSPFRESFRTEDAVLEGRMAMRPEIAQQRVGDASHRFRPSFDARNGVGANAQNLGVVPGKLGKIFLVSRYLNGSDRSESERVERQNNVLFTPETRELHLGIQV